MRDPNEKQIQSILPPEIIKIIKKKSSRDPFSRFSNKLHILLTYAGNDLQKQEEIGVGWVDNNKFRINKKKLIVSMDIKINTLNVNLKSLNFHQLHTDQNGWSVWEKSGFCVNSTVDDITDNSPESNNSENQTYTNGQEVDQPIQVYSSQINQKFDSLLCNIHLGYTSLEQLQTFQKITISVWDELIAAHSEDPTLAQEFIGLLAERFRLSHQRFENAKSVLNAIFVCEDTTNEPHVTIRDFARFLAKFGPEETSMRKIQSLIKASNSNGNWLCFGTDNNNSDFFGCYDSTDANCINLYIGNKLTKIWNLVDVACPGEYLIDSNGIKYSSWENYFVQNPIVSEKDSFLYD